MTARKKNLSPRDLLKARVNGHQEIADQIIWLLERSLKVRIHISEGKCGLPKLGKSLADNAVALRARSDAEREASAVHERDALHDGSDLRGQVAELECLSRSLKILAELHLNDAARLRKEIQRVKPGRPIGSVAPKTATMKKPPGAPSAVPEVSGERAYLVVKLMSKRGLSAQETARLAAVYVLNQRGTKISGIAREKALKALEANIAKKASREKKNRERGQ